jgi:PAS domain S-box-containing protein
VAERRQPIRVLVAEDEEPLRLALCDLVSGEEGLELAGAAADADGAIEQAAATLPDVALLDIRMPAGGGVRAAKEIAVLSPETRMIALSAYDDRGSVVGMLRSGAIGYLVKGVSPAEIVEAIVRAGRGQASLPAKLLSEVAGALSSGADERFEALLESAPDAVVITDPDGRIVLVNAQTEKLFGYPRGELLGRPVETLLPARLQARHVGHRTGYLASPVTRPMGAGLQLAGRRLDGSEFPVDISLSAVETPEGRLVAAFVRDVTEREARVELERELAARRAVLSHLVSAGEEERRQIAADIHDDSIQVMTAAGMRLQILRRSLVEAEQLARLDDLEETIRLSIARLRHLIFELRPPALDHEGLGAALRMYLDESAGESEAVFRLDDQLVREPSESTRLVLYRIAQEVVANARKHSGAGAISVKLAERDGGYHVQVADDGVGFTPDLSDRRPGHLGLAAIRERAELAGGWLEVESAPGSGTVVDFWIAGEAGGIGARRALP